MAHDKGLLSNQEYSVMCQWYEYIESNVDIGLDLLGNIVIINDDNNYIIHLWIIIITAILCGFHFFYINIALFA